MLEYKFNKFLSLPEVKFIKKRNLTNHTIEFEAIKQSTFEVCPKCATKSYKVYDHVYVNIKDTPIRDKQVFLKIRKRRFKCPNCSSVFREPVQGIVKGFRSTQRFRSHIRWCASNFTDLKRVKDKCKCSTWMVYKAYYEQLNLEVKKLDYPWPKTIGIDEHSFVRNTKTHFKEFATIFVDFNNDRVRDVALGRSYNELSSSHIMDIKGRENVKNVVIDMSTTFKKFARSHFPNSTITVDKFHVIKLFNHHLNTIRIETMKHRVFEKSRTSPMRRLYLTNRSRLNRSQRNIVDHINWMFGELGEIYEFKEQMLKIYNMRGKKRAEKAYIKLTDAMALSGRKQVQSLRRTLMKWRKEILNYFRTRITNGKTEGYNRKAKLIQRKAYGYRKFENYRLKLIYDCR
ncbi:transposase [Bacteriovorax sp. BAL6_X]|uniref:ISL3 family transposase n=2 Tax=Bacteriovorax sp. BAL6_X TaxID=1201290 RepID=UPI00038569BC|nr:ISL3 family transposase [Bacteriovorax sp. BAL6_X]EPZ51469.1 transposase [Bacteriovorax sp. BAL6_X]